MTRPRALVAALVLASGLALGGQVAAPAPARADSRVTVDNDGSGGARADLRYRTTLQVTGSGFQVVRNGFGGVYVMFGWVDDPRGGSWKPSRGGLTGQDYRYVPDSENTTDNAGYLKFIAFPGSSTAAEAHGVLSRSGAFRVDLTVPGPVFETLDRTGAVRSVDCRTVTCGVITIGAHGVRNPANETFTPVSFGEVYAAEPTPSGATQQSEEAGTSGQAQPAPAGADAGAGTGSATDGASSGTSTGTASPGAAAAPQAVGKPRVATDRATAVAGHALTFTGGGFGPGEQVVAVLDDGAAALTTTAGASGEVVGVIQLPADAPAGTHELRVTGAATGRAATERFPLQTGSDPVEVTAATAAGPDGAGGDEARGLPVAPGPLFAGAAALVLLVSVAGLVRARRRRAAVGPGVPAPSPSPLSSGPSGHAGVPA